MTGEERPPPNPPARGEAETTRETIRDFAETPPAKTMADIKAASEIYEANAQKMASKNIEKASKQEG